MRKTSSKKRLAAAAATAKSSIRSAASRRRDSPAAWRRRVAMGTAAAPQRNPAFMTRESTRSAASPRRGAERGANPRPQHACGKAGIGQRLYTWQTLGKPCRECREPALGAPRSGAQPRVKASTGPPARTLLSCRSRLGPWRGARRGAQSAAPAVPGFADALGPCWDRRPEEAGGPTCAFLQNLPEARAAFNPSPLPCRLSKWRGGASTTSTPSPNYWNIS